MPLQKAFERFLGFCVRKAIARERPFIIGVAGSVGKSSTKTAIGIALGDGDEDADVVATKKNYNNELGVPLTIFQSDAPGKSPFSWIALLSKAYLTRLGLMSLPAKTYVLEMGTDHPGDLAYLTSIARPHIGVLTAISAEHTEFFGSIEGVAREESTILHALSQSDVGVLNSDDPRVLEMAGTLACRSVTFGASEQATARIISHEVVLNQSVPEDSGLLFRISMTGTTWDVRLKGTVGYPQAYAVAAALAVVIALDGDEDLAVKRLEDRFRGMPGRMRLIEGIKRTWLIDDSYNSSPLAALSAIKDLATFPVSMGSQRIAALGDMLELGSLAESSHADVGRAVAESGIDMLVACGTLAHVVAQAARDAGMAEDRIFTFAQSAEAGRFIQDKLKEGDVVLVKGSQGARMERVTKELMAHPDRAEELLVRHTKDWLEKK